MSVIYQNGQYKNILHNKISLIKQELEEKLEDSSKITQITWDSNSNMNDFKTSGVYNIYGERTRQDDNLPILNAASGNSIAAKLTVIASTLQPDNTEICITQFLQLSNRVGGDGNMYVRTYNENNSPHRDWWSSWQKLQGVREGYIFTDNLQINPDGGIQEIPYVTGLCNMVDNGIYTGIYTNDPTFNNPSKLETFILVVINDYAAVGAVNNKVGWDMFTRQISQLKYSIDVISGQITIKKRSCSGDNYNNINNWSSWTEIGGSNVDLSTYVKKTELASVATSGSYYDLSNRPTIPSAVTSSTVSNWGFTKNSGTITGVDTTSLIDGIDAKKIVNTTSSSMNLQPNVYHRNTNTSLSSLTITLDSAANTSTVNEYFVEFTTRSSGTTISLPSSIKWHNGETPTFESGYTYQISIINNLGVCAKFK